MFCEGLSSRRELCLFFVLLSFPTPDVLFVSLTQVKSDRQFCVDRETVLFIHWIKNRMKRENRWATKDQHFHIFVAFVSGDSRNCHCKACQGRWWCTAVIDRHVYSSRLIPDYSFSEEEHTDFTAWTRREEQISCNQMPHKRVKNRTTRGLYSSTHHFIDNILEDTFMNCLHELNKRRSDSFPSVTQMVQDSCWCVSSRHKYRHKYKG